MTVVHLRRRPQPQYPPTWQSPRLGVLRPEIRAMLLRASRQMGVDPVELLNACVFYVAPWLPNRPAVGYAEVVNGPYPGGRHIDDADTQVIGRGCGVGIE